MKALWLSVLCLCSLSNEYDSCHRYTTQIYSWIPSKELLLPRVNRVMVYLKNYMSCSVCLFCINMQSFPQGYLCHLNFLNNCSCSSQYELLQHITDTRNKKFSTEQNAWTSRRGKELPIPQRHLWSLESITSWIKACSLTAWMRCQFSSVSTVMLTSNLPPVTCISNRSAMMGVILDLKGPNLQC